MYPRRFQSCPWTALAQSGQAEPSTDLHFRAEEDRVGGSMHEQPGDRCQAADAGKGQISIGRQRFQASAHAGKRKPYAGDQARKACLHKQFQRYGVGAQGIELGLLIQRIDAVEGGIARPDPKPWVMEGPFPT